MKIWFLTRSLYPYQKTGGGQIRLGQIEFLRKMGWQVTVVMPGYDIKNIKKDKNLIQIPFLQNLKLSSRLERIGFYEDYFDIWIKSALNYLKNEVQKVDIVFATSGGELGMIKLGALLKHELGCQFVVNFHDPLIYSLVNGLKIDNKYHVSREKEEKKYLMSSDLIVTSSKVNKKSLMNKNIFSEDKIVNNYFGYIKKVNLNDYTKKVSNKLRIAYVGNMGSLQKPEILFQIFQHLNRRDIEIYFIGESSAYAPLQGLKDKDVHFIDFMPHDEFLEFMIENIDVGFVSLTSDYLGACVPSKIYEYINLGLPMIGALPFGDGADIINHNGYGISCNYNDIKSLVNAIEQFMNVNYLKKIQSNILKDRDDWSMKYKINDLNLLLTELKNSKGERA